MNNRDANSTNRRIGRLREAGHTVEDAMRNAIELLEQGRADVAADGLRDALADVEELADAATAFRAAFRAAYTFPHKPGENSAEYVAALDARDAAEARMLDALANMQGEG